jgi:hypothetical protein
LAGIREDTLSARFIAHDRCCAASPPVSRACGKTRQAAKDEITFDANIEIAPSSE